MKKGLKLLLSLATVFMVSGTVTACNVDKRTPEEKVQEAYDSLVYSGLNAVTSDIELITSVADLEDVLAHHERKMQIIVTELKEIQRKYGDKYGVKTLYPRNGKR